MARPRIAALCCLYDELTWLNPVYTAIYPVCDAIYFSVNSLPWAGTPRDLTPTFDFLRQLPDPDRKLRLLTDTWKSEIEQRTFGFANIQVDGFDYMCIVDGDEVYDTNQLRRMIDVATADSSIGSWHVRWYTYWKSLRYRIDPIEPYDPPVLIRAGAGGFVETRNISAERHELIPPEICICHHLSYARTDEQVLRKISSFSHSHEIVPDWYENVWKRWDHDHTLENLHPVTPEYYKRAIEQPKHLLPPVLRDLQ